MDLPESPTSTMKQYVISPQPLNYQPENPCKIVKMENRLRLKKQRERQRAKRRAARQLLPEFKKAQYKSTLEQVRDTKFKIPHTTGNILTSQGIDAGMVHTYSTPIAGHPGEMELPDFMKSAIPKLHLTFTDHTFDSTEVYNDSYVQQKKLQWCEELDSAREEVTEALKMMREKAEKLLKMSDFHHCCVHQMLSHVMNTTIVMLMICKFDHQVTSVSMSHIQIPICGNL